MPYIRLPEAGLIICIILAGSYYPITPMQGCLDIASAQMDIVQVRSTANEYPLSASISAKTLKVLRCGWTKSEIAVFSIMAILTAARS